MNDNITTDLVVFYAWQSDLPENANTRVIRAALREVSSRIENEFAEKKLRVVLDEATRGEPGSPNIPATILEKITRADVFVCDVTTISGDSAPKTPNPNVVFELGYAVSCLGWERVIMLFNREFGTFPIDMPFDFDRHRASPYAFAEPEKSLSRKELQQRQAPLVNMLFDALKAIVECNPEKSSMTPTQIKRARDVNNLMFLMSAIHIPTLERCIIDLPGKLHLEAACFLDVFNETTDSLSFHLYDDTARQLVYQLRESWNNTLMFIDNYEYLPLNGYSVFHYPAGHPTEETDKVLKNLNEFQGQLFHALNNLLIYLREHYLEIDVDELSDKAWSDYQKVTAFLRTDIENSDA